jgi:Outer membrane protein beta-barrel domain
MKKSIIALAICLFLIHFCEAQNFTWGMKGGLSKSLSKPKELFLVLSADTAYILKVNKQKSDVHIGLYARFGDNFYFQPEINYNSKESLFSLDNNIDKAKVKKDNISEFNFPLLLGFRIENFMFNGGIVGNYHLSNKSELKEFEDYTTNFEKINWGWQAGIAIGTGPIGLDFRFENNPKKFGDHLAFLNSPTPYKNNSNRLIFSLIFKIQ